MPLPFPLPPLSAVKAFVTSKRFLIPLAVILLMIAIGFGVSRHLNHQTDTRVQEAVKTVNTKATNKTLEAHARVQTKNAEVEARAIKLKVRTTEEYTNARNAVQTAPVEHREAPVPPLIIDTLNELDRLHQTRRSN